MNKYILKNGQQVESIPIGKAKITIGLKNNRLTVCDRGPNPTSKKTQVICKCDCGNYTMINLQDFLSGKVQSCGCYSNEVKAQRMLSRAIDFSDETRNINPFYEYIAPTKLRKWEQVVWEVECRKCKKHYYAPPNELISEKRTHGINPCTCYKTFSIGVQKIYSLLTDNNILFEQEKTFSTCISPKGNWLPFDFYLPEYNILIEYDGEQHYKVCFGQNENKLKQQQEYDLIKTEWCKNNNKQLIRIPYYYKKITIQDLIPEKIREEL